MPWLQKKIKRDRVFITTKVWYTHLGFEETLKSVTQSLTSLNSWYIDLYLIHWPKCYDHITWMDCSSASKGTWQDSWKAMEKLYAEGVLLNIGISNFDINLLNQLQKNTTVSPQVIQNWMDPSHIETKEVLEFCKSNQISYQAYAGVRSLSDRLSQSNEWSTYVKSTAYTKSISPAQVIFKWFIQHGIAILTRSKQTEHQRSNRALFTFTLSEQEMHMIGGGDILELSPINKWVSTPDRINQNTVAFTPVHTINRVKRLDEKLIPVTGVSLRVLVFLAVLLSCVIVFTIIAIFHSCMIYVVKTKCPCLYCIMFSRTWRKQSINKHY